ncbi:hypothetical protein TTHERM_01309110 (macronuclear) [Tetrahymena thermophila SB210]|uniref:Uncharacterized protein n=1 Tax=Tetrahymena thermophila (strain SB210) TaxID=312017 RepID=Q229Y5_TETTS|nr:hypothetical protein TTHERM_01309110 [Tetrahymena thermophila SB210]EAR82102.2 hypothetical protein TTHERM_01309110 [Tetrahymena thermophila SB210]|eukprot:XP_001029765.2 hypothetical protein TTHERM_01309110 [Tetrahymena thermophila SB210]
MISLRTQKDLEVFRNYLENKYQAFQDKLKKVHVTFDPIDPIQKSYIDEFLKIIKSHCMNINHLEVHGLNSVSIKADQLLEVFIHPEANNLKTIILDFSVKEQNPINQKLLVDVMKNQPKLNYLSLSINEGNLESDQQIIDAVINSGITTLKILHNYQVGEAEFSKFKLNNFSRLFSRYGMIQFLFMANNKNRFEFAINQLYFAQIVVFQKKISNLMHINPQQLLFDLYENPYQKQSIYTINKMQGPNAILE